MKDLGITFREVAGRCYEIHFDMSLSPLHRDYQGSWKDVTQAILNLGQDSTLSLIFNVCGPTFDREIIEEIHRSLWIDQYYQRLLTLIHFVDAVLSYQGRLVGIANTSLYDFYFEIFLSAPTAIATRRGIKFGFRDFKLDLFPPLGVFLQTSPDLKAWRKLPIRHADDSGLKLKIMEYAKQEDIILDLELDKKPRGQLKRNINRSLPSLWEDSFVKGSIHELSQQLGHSYLYPSMLSPDVWYYVYHLKKKPANHTDLDKKLVFNFCLRSFKSQQVLKSFVVEPSRKTLPAYPDSIWICIDISNAVPQLAFFLKLLKQGWLLYLFSSERSRLQANLELLHSRVREEWVKFPWIELSWSRQVFWGDFEPEFPFFIGFSFNDDTNFNTQFYPSLNGSTGHIMSGVGSVSIAEIQSESAEMFSQKYLRIFDQVYFLPSGQEGILISSYLLSLLFEELVRFSQAKSFTFYETLAELRQRGWVSLGQDLFWYKFLRHKESVDIEGYVQKHSLAVSLDLQFAEKWSTYSWGELGANRNSNDLSLDVRILMQMMILSFSHLLERMDFLDDVVCDDFLYSLFADGLVGLHPQWLKQQMNEIQALAMVDRYLHPKYRKLFEQDNS